MTNFTLELNRRGCHLLLEKDHGAEAQVHVTLPFAARPHDMRRLQSDAGFYRGCV